MAASSKPVQLVQFLRDTAQFVIWMDVPVALRVAVPAFESMVPRALLSSAELTALRDGSVQEDVVHIEMLYLSGSTSVDAGEMWRHAKILRDVQQDALNGRGSDLQPGTYMDATGALIHPSGTPPPLVITPPSFLTPLSISQITQTTVVINAEVDQSCLFKVQYGTTDYASETALTSVAATTFQATLTSLTAGTQYQARVYAENTASPAVTVTSAPQIFTTAAVALSFLIGPSLSQVTSNSARVDATANATSTMTVEVNATATPSTVTVFGPTASGTVHAQVLTGLVAGTSYQWKAKLTSGAVVVTSATGAFSTAAIVVTPPPPPLPTGNEMALLLGGPTGAIYSRATETDAQILALLDLLDTEFWRRAPMTDPIYGIDIFSPGMAPGAMTYQNCRTKMLTGGGGDDFIRHCYWMGNATGNGDYFRAARRIAEVAVTDPSWLTNGYPDISQFPAFYGNAISWALVALDHPTSTVRTTARGIVASYAYMAAKSRGGNIFDVREASHELAWMLCAYILGMTTLTAAPGQQDVGPIDTAARLRLKIDNIITNPTDATKSQQTDGSWYERAAGGAGGMEPERTFTGTTTSGLATITWTSGATAAADIPIGLTLVGTGIVAGGSTVLSVVGTTVTIANNATASGSVSLTVGGLPDTRKKPFMDGCVLQAMSFYARVFPADKARIVTALMKTYRDATPGPKGWLAKTRDVDGTVAGGAPLDYSNLSTQLTPAYVYEVNGAGGYFQQVAGAYSLINESATAPHHYASLNAWHIDALAWLYYDTADTAYQALAQSLIKGLISSESTGRPSGGGRQELTSPWWKNWNQCGDSTRNLAALRDPVANPPPPPPSSGTWSYSIGLEEILHEENSKPYHFPDSVMGITQSDPGGTQPFNFFASTTSGGRIQRTRGTLAKPCLQYGAAITTANGLLTGVPSEFGYYGGGSIYQYSPTKWVMFTIGENWSDPNSGAIFRNHICLAKSIDQGLSWAHVGKIVKANVSYASPQANTINISSGNHIVITDGGTPYFYCFFTDVDGEPIQPSDRHLGVARCSVAAVETWIDGGATAVFNKYLSGAWTSPALTGGSSALPEETGFSFRDHMSVAYNTFLGRYIIASGYAAPPASGDDKDIFFQDAASPLGPWSNRQYIFLTPGRMESRNTLIALDGSSQDRIGQSFYIYYQASDPPMNRVTDDKLCRRLISIVGLTPPPPATQTFDIAAQFSATQGQNGWNYLDDLNSQLTYDTNLAWIGVQPFMRIDGMDSSHIYMCPGTTRKVKLRWTAPRAGSVDVSADAYDLSPTVGDGVIITIRHNATTLGTINLPNGQVLPLTYTTTGVTTAAGDIYELELSSGLANNNDGDPTGVKFALALT